MNIQNGFTSIEQMVGQIGTKQSPIQNPKGNTIKPADTLSFQNILKKTKEAAEEETGNLRFSKHANQRLESRNIDLSQNQLKRLETGTQKAREKGIQESLVMIDNLAFIVNVKNNMVVTAVNNTEDGIFTNIDGAVIS
ncbi:MAG: TIGR02530 family flagellar biosynthesis protein [Acetivibrio sp.]